MTCCVSPQFDNWCNDVEILLKYEGQIYCIFHAPVECQQKMELWDKENDLVFRRILNAKSGEEICNLKGTVFPFDLSLEKLTETEALPRVHFDDSTFHGEASFHGVTFDGAVDFDRTIFKREALFFGTTFNANVSFRKTVFIEEARFYLATFNGFTEFYNAKFNCAAEFSHTKFKKYANFIRSKFLSTCMCKETEFDDVTFSVADFNRFALFEKVIFNNAFFGGCLVGSKISFDQCSLKGLSLLDSPIENFRFTSCLWPRTDGRNTLFSAKKILI